MIEFKVPLKQFDLEEFIGDIVRFLNEQGIGDPDALAVIAEVDENGYTPEWGEDRPGRDLPQELVVDGKTLFFAFSSTNIGEPIPCADGNTYHLDADEDYDEDSEDDNADDDAEENAGSLAMGETDVVGYVMSVRGGQVVFQTGIHGPGMCFNPPSVTMLHHMGIFEEGMKDYLKRFMK